MYVVVAADDEDLMVSVISVDHRSHNASVLIHLMLINAFFRLSEVVASDLW